MFFQPSYIDFLIKKANKYVKLILREIVIITKLMQIFYFTNYICKKLNFQSWSVSNSTRSNNNNNLKWNKFSRRREELLYGFCDWRNHTEKRKKKHIKNMLNIPFSIYSNVLTIDTILKKHKETPAWRLFNNKISNINQFLLFWTDKIVDE
jgi:hypothetical protein